MVEYIAFALTRLVPLMVAMATGGTFKEISKSRFSEIRIPLPPVETQRAVVAELEAERGMINTNSELVERFEKKIQAAIGRVWGDGEHGRTG